jgi:predicted ATP-dependent serine protease
MPPKASSKEVVKEEAGKKLPGRVERGAGPDPEGIRRRRHHAPGFEDKTKQVPAIPTGALTLDIAVGVGGVPRGRVIEIFGPESSGKTTLVLHIIANAQKSWRAGRVH